MRHIKNDRVGEAQEYQQSNVFLVMSTNLMSTNYTFVQLYFQSNNENISLLIPRINIFFSDQHSQCTPNVRNT